MDVSTGFAEGCELMVDSKDGSTVGSVVGSEVETEKVGTEKG